MPVLHVRNQSTIKKEQIDDQTKLGDDCKWFFGVNVFLEPLLPKTIMVAFCKSFYFNMVGGSK